MEYESNRQDGLRKLKRNAVPSIFSFSKPVIVRKPPTKRSAACQEEEEICTHRKVLKLDHCYAQEKTLDSANRKQTSRSDSDTENEIRKDSLSNFPTYCVPFTEVRNTLETTPSLENIRDNDVIIELKTEIIDLTNKINELKTRIKHEYQKRRRVLKAKRKQRDNLEKIFNRDQIDRFGDRSSRGTEWSSDTVKKALSLRFACGATGYELLLSTGYPLPSIRTLQRRVEGVDFRPGMLEDVFAFMKIKVNSMKMEERDCCLTLDEMAITSGVDYDTSTGTLLGDATIISSKGGDQGLATHALVFMLSGITTRWKQTVAYHFSGNSIDGLILRNLIKQIIFKAENIGLKVIAVTSDMGAANQAMWREFGIYVTRHLPTVNKIEHPNDKSRQLYFLADVPHVIKNLKAALISNNVITLPESIVKKYSLPSSIVSKQPLDELQEYQRKLTLKLAPKLTESCLKPSHFDKMKVGQALNIFSHSVSAGIRYMVQEDGYPRSFLATAWFLDFMNKWFDLMASRSPITALSKFKEDAYTDAINHLNDAILLFSTVKIGHKGGWKPVQTGVILSTTSILDIQKDLLAQGYRFILTSRFTQDCLENLFSCVRQKNPIPSPLEFKYSLKMITLAQFLKISVNTNYMTDESDYLAEFLDVLRQSRKNEKEETDLNNDLESIELGEALELSKAELNSLFYLVGYCIYTTKKRNTHCEECISYIESKDGEDVPDFSKLIKLKDYKDGCLTRPSESIFNVVKAAECMFRDIEKNLCGRKNIQKSLSEKFMENHEDKLKNIPNCHLIIDKLLNNYFSLRLRIYSNMERNRRRKDLKNKGEYGSKTMTMHSLVKSLK